MWAPESLKPGSNCGQGGVQPTENTDNPFDVAGDGLSGQATAMITLDTAGDYPYFFDFHPGTMNGVVYVQ